MYVFAKTQRHSELIHIPGFTYPTPIVYYLPKTGITAKTPIVLFSQGLYGTNNNCELIAHHFFDDKILFSYEKLAHGDNKNKGSLNVKKWVKEFKGVIDHIKTEYPNRKIYLLGESFGSSIIIHYLKKYANQVAGSLFWNMPKKIIDAANNSKMKRLWIGLKMIPVCFGITTYNKRPKEPIKNLTNNAYVIRIRYLNPTIKENNLTAFGAWNSMRRAWRVFAKKIIPSSINYYYVQSCQDYLGDFKVWQKVKKQFSSKRLIEFKQGWHLLSIEEKTSDQLWKIAQKMIDQK